MRRARVVAVHAGEKHGLGKPRVERLTVQAGLGVAGDAHFGARVQHRSRVAADPTQPNLRQIHLIHEELFDELGTKGFEVLPGQLGENVTTRGIDLLELPTGTILRIGDVLIAVTGLRNPCKQIEAFQPGLLRELIERRGDTTIRKAGVMGVVVAGGEIRAGDDILWALPPGSPIALARV